ncbi:MAG: hypothetical protein AABY87_04290 [bacterium]
MNWINELKDWTVSCSAGVFYIDFIKFILVSFLFVILLLGGFYVVKKMSARAVSQGKDAGG